MAEPQTANEDLLDAAVRHQIRLGALSNGIFRKISALLTQADAELIQKIATKTNGTFTKRRLEALLVSIRAQNLEAQAAIAGELRTDLTDLSEFEAEWAVNSIKQAVPIRLDVVSPTPVTLRALVTSDPIGGSLFKEVIDDWGRARSRRIRESIRMGVVQGETIDQMVRRVRGTRARQFQDGVLAISRRGAQAIVRTSVNAVSSKARELVYEENDDLVKGVRWVSTLDGRTTAICRARDGRIWPAGEGPRPPAHWACRSTTVPVLKSWRQMGIDEDEATPATRASLNGQVPGDITYGPWLRKQPREFVNEVMGQQKGALFLDGKLPIDRFVDRAGNELTLNQLQTRERAAWTRAFND